MRAKAITPIPPTDSPSTKVVSAERAKRWFVENFDPMRERPCVREKEEAVKPGEGSSTRTTSGKNKIILMSRKMSTDAA